MKKLITHINPHLDDISAIWLIKKFIPGFSDAEVDFISANEGKDGAGDDEDKLYVGVGMGKYDEHKGDLGECATSLVWLDIKAQGLAPKDPLELAAYEDFVHWNILADTAQLQLEENFIFNVDVFIRSHKNDPVDSLKTIKLGEEIAERLLPVLKAKQRFLKDWEKRVEFESKWGKGVAVETSALFQEIAYQKGFELVIYANPKTGYLGIFAPAKSDIDLSPVYEKVKELEPKAGWFLHHSKKLLLCGAPASPSSPRSKLTLSELTEVVKSVR